MSIPPDRPVNALTKGPGRVSRRGFMTIAAGGAVLPFAGAAVAQSLTPIIIAEPLHSTGYLPVYIAIRKGFFAAENLAARILTVESGSGHTNAVLSGQAFAFVGGPEHDAYAKAKGGELRCIVNVVDRGNVYLVAKKGVAADPKDLAGTLKGKSIAVNFFGGTPNSILRYLLIRAKLDPAKDVKMVETTSAGALAAVKGGQADMAVITEPQVTQGIRAGLWDEPFYNVPKEFGPYAYSTLNIRADSIEKDPKMVQGFVRAVIKGLNYTYGDPAGAAEIARQEFPTMPPEDLKATLDRSFADNLWSRDGQVSRAAWDTAKSVVMQAGILKQDVPYDAIIDMRFVGPATTAKAAP